MNVILSSVAQLNRGGHKQQQQQQKGRKNKRNKKWKQNGSVEKGAESGVYEGEEEGIDRRKVVLANARVLLDHLCGDAPGSPAGGAGGAGGERGAKGAAAALGAGVDERHLLRRVDALTHEVAEMVTSNVPCVVETVFQEHAHMLSFEDKVARGWANHVEGQWMPGESMMNAASVVWPNPTGR